MSLFTILRIVRLRFEKIQRDFLWGGGVLKNKIHLVKRLWKRFVVEENHKGKVWGGRRELEVRSGERFL